MTATAIRKIKAGEEQDTCAVSGYELRILAAWRRASVMHLVDLKRAQHSPTRTELVVDRRSDRIIAEPARSKRVRGASKGAG